MHCGYTPGHTHCAVFMLLYYAFFVNMVSVVFLSYKNIHCGTNAKVMGIYMYTPQWIVVVNEYINTITVIIQPHPMQLEGQSLWWERMEC